MQTVTINFTVSGQTLNVTNLPIKIASNTVKYVKAVFALDSDWTGFDVVSAIWYNDFAQIAVVLDENGECMIPHEVLAKPDDVMVNLVGRDIVNDELVDRLTTYPAKALDVDANAKITGTETAPVTPSQFEQYIAIVEQLVGSVKDIDHTELNADYTLTIYYTDGTSDTVGPIRGAQGEAGNGILSAVLNPDYTLTLNYTNGQHDTVGPIRGAQGETGNGIQSIYLTGTSGAVKTYTILFTDGNTTEFQVTDGEVTNAVLESLMPTDTASGAIASFPDGQSVFPLKSLVAEINPIQDLHGYSSPWVGGGGKNKFSGEYFVGDVSTHYLDFFGGHSATGAFKDNGISVKANTTYAVSISFPTTPDGNWGVYGAYTESTTIITFSANASGATRTFTFTPTTDTKVVFWGYISDTWAQHNVSTIDGIKVQVEQGSATSWAPYSNICPISGTDEVGVVDDPTYGGFINWNQLIDVKSSSASKTENGVTFTDNRDGTYTISTGSGGATSVAYLSLGAFSVINGHKYVFISCPNGGGNNTYRAYLTGSVGSGGYDTGSGFLYTASATGTTYCVCAWIASGQVLTTPITFKPQLFDLTQMFGSGNEPTTVDEFKAIFPNDYYAYNAGTKTNASAVNGTPYISHTTTLPSTVYGGTLNVVSGVLTVTHAIETISSVSGSAEVNGFRLNNTLSGIKEAYGYCLCNMATRATAYREAVNVGGDTPNRIGYNDSGVILLNIQGITTIAELNTLLAQTPLVIVYELATPTTIQLTASQINTLKGTNNIFSTAGDVSVEYVADIQGYIDKKL